MSQTIRSLLEKPILQWTVATYFLLAVGACSEPVKTGPGASEPVPAEMPTTPVPVAPKKSGTKGEPASKPRQNDSGLGSATLDSSTSLSPTSAPLTPRTNSAAPRPKPLEPPVIIPAPASVFPEVRLLLEDKSITLRGQLNSEFLIRDIVSRLSELNGYTVHNQIVYHRKVQGAQWANNLADVLPMLVQLVPDLKLQLKDDTVTLIGKVAKASDFGTIVEAVGANLDGTEIATIDNQLKTGP